MNVNARFFPLMMAAGLLAGCSHSQGLTGPLSHQGPARSAPHYDAALALEKDMTADEVEKLLGKPDAVRPFNSPEAQGKAEVWVYFRVLDTTAKLEGVGVEERQYIDPFTLDWRTIPEPVYGQKLSTYTEMLHLLWVDGKLVTWVRNQKGDVAYY